MGGVLASTMGELAGGLVAQEAAEEVEVEVTEVINEGVGDGGGPEVEPEEGESEDKGEEGEEAALQCSICLDEVLLGSGNRSTANLRCGHQFHLGERAADHCLNMNLKLVIALDRHSMPRELCNAPIVARLRRPLRIRWGHLSEFPSLFGGTDPSPPTDFLDGQNINAEPIALSEPDTSLLSAYFAYLNPSAPPGSSSSFLVVERAVDGSAHHDHWNPIAGPSDGQPLQTQHPIEFHDNLSLHMPPEQPRLPVGEMRIGGADNGGQQRWLLPHELYGNGAERPRSPGVPPANGPAVVSLPDNPFYLFPPASSGSRSEEATESGGGNRFDSWDQGHFARRLFGLAGSGSSPQPENSSADDDSFHQMHFPGN
ncbi:hypothetical protein EJB05_30554, partial [Eragrostis curvula]